MLGATFSHFGWNHDCSTVNFTFRVSAQFLVDADFPFYAYLIDSFVAGGWSGWMDYFGIVEHWWHDIACLILSYIVFDFYMDQFMLNFEDLRRAVAALRHIPRQGPSPAPSACPCHCSHLSQPTPSRLELESGI